MKSSTPALGITRFLRFSIMHRTKDAMLARAEELGYADLLEQTWSCWQPQADGSPCQKCAACRHRHIPGQKVDGGTPSPPVETKRQPGAMRKFVAPRVKKQETDKVIKASAVREDTEDDDDDDSDVMFEGGDPFAQVY